MNRDTVSRICLQHLAQVYHTLKMWYTAVALCLKKYTATLFAFASAKEGRDWQ